MLAVLLLIFFNMSDLEARISLQKILGQCFGDNVSLFIWSTSIQETVSI